MDDERKRDAAMIRVALDAIEAGRTDEGYALINALTNSGRRFPDQFARAVLALRQDDERSQLQLQQLLDSLTPDDAAHLRAEVDAAMKRPVDLPFQVNKPGLGLFNAGEAFGLAANRARRASPDE